MKQFKTLILILTIAIAGWSIFLVKKLQKFEGQTKYTIGILQTASHPALNAAREGFIATMQEALANDVTFIIQNAEGSVANAHALAQRFHANKNINAIFAIATPAAQAMAAVEKEKPIFIAAVTDPQALGIIKPNSNVTGSSDMINVPGLVTLLQELIPTAKTVALLYNNAEINSKMLAEKMIADLTAAGIKTIKICISCEADLTTAIETGLRNADLIVTPTDNMVASAISMIATRALQAKKPLIVSDNLLVKYGPLASRGVDYFKSGAQAATMALDVLLHGKKPSELPIQQAISDTIFINKKTLKILNLTVPEKLLPNVVFIEGT